MRSVNLSAVLIVLGCFFLPWVQVSCAGSHANLSGMDLARDGHTGLWLIPIVILVLLIFEIIRLWKSNLFVYSIANSICGVIILYLMNRERGRFAEESGLIAAQLTAWFWLGLFASVILTGSGIFLALRGSRTQTP